MQNKRIRYDCNVKYMREEARAENYFVRKHIYTEISLIISYIYIILKLQWKDVVPIYSAWPSIYTQWYVHLHFICHKNASTVYRNNNIFIALRTIILSAIWRTYNTKRKLKIVFLEYLLTGWYINRINEVNKHGMNYSFYALKINKFDFSGF